MADERPTLMMVEDDLGLQKQMRWSFDQYNVVFAQDRESAIAQLRRHEPAVVTLDLGLPPDADGTSEGFATLEQIVSLAPATKVIVLTGQIAPMP
jgi:two-component system NtrC family response regulator